MPTTPDAYDYQIGFASGSMVLLENVAVSGSNVPVSYPKSTFQPYADQVDLVSGLVRGLGWPRAVWIWSVLSREERDALRQYCPGKSADIYIRTKTMDTADVYHTYSAVMVWPTQDEERDWTRRLGFKIEFRKMVLIV